MRKTTLILCAVCALAACNKEFPSDGTVNASDVVFDFCVNNLDDTKAVKSGWEDGDCVFIFFEDVTTGYVSTVYDADSDDWTATLHGEAALSTAGKRLTAVHLPFGNALTPSYNGGWTFDEIQYTYYLVAEAVDYSIADTGDVAQLSATLDMRNPEGYVQFFIQDAGDRTLYTDAVVPTGVGSIGADGTVTEVTGLDGEGFPNPMVGYSYAGGKLFSGKLAAEQVKSLNDKFTYYFILSDGKHFHKMLDAAIPSHSAIKLPAVSSGSWVQTGVAYGVDIQGTTWETVNLGAQYPWEYGNRYTWDDMLQDVRDGWHIPEYGDFGTTDGFRSILSCNRYWTSIKGINGCIYEDPNNANHFIFLPANGDWDIDNGVIKQIGESGNYWTSSEANYAYAYLLMFTEYDEQDIFSDSKDVLLGVRLVAD